MITKQPTPEDMVLPLLDGGAGPAMPIAAGSAQAMIQAAITGGMPGGPGSTGGGESATTATPGGSSASGMSGMGAKLALVATIAAVAVGGVLLVRGSGSKADVGPATAPPAASTSTNPPATTLPATNVAQTDPAPAPMVATTPTATPSAPKTPRKAKRKVPAALAPADLLRRANDARKNHKWRDAYGFYQQLRRQHPRSRGAYVATVAAAQLALGKLGKPSAALRLFRRSVSREPSGFLAEESRFGMTEAYRALGNKSQERMTLSAFLKAYPTSALSKRAKSRLRALDAETK